MLKRFFLFGLLLLLTTSAFSQQLILERDSIVKKPISIYTLKNPIVNKENVNHISESYQIPKFDFVFLDFRDLEEGAFIIDPKNFRKKPSRLIYDSYNDFYNLPQRGFMRKYDPTLWWICP